MDVLLRPIILVVLLSFRLSFGCRGYLYLSDSERSLLLLLVSTLHEIAAVMRLV